MQFVANLWHWCSIDDLGVGGRTRVNIHSSQVIWLSKWCREIDYLISTFRTPGQELRFRWNQAVPDSEAYQLCDIAQIELFHHVRTVSLHRFNA